MTPPPAPPSPASRLWLDDPGEIIAGIPAVIGFPPVDSFVVITLRVVADRLWLSGALRADLPEPRDGPELIQQLGLVAITNEADGVVPVVVGGVGCPSDLPHRWLVELLAREMVELDIPVSHAAWVPTIEQDVTWWCYENDECTGQLPDPRSTSFAAVHALAGVVGYASRAEMAAHLAPDSENRVAHRAQLLAELAAAGDNDTPAQRWEMVLAAIDATEDHRLPPDLDDERIVRLADALRDPLVRDNCFPLLLTEKADAAELLWTTLTRAIPAPERAEPACLLGMHAYLRGEGVLANLALSVALEANPGHQMAGLLAEALSRGTPPTWLRRMVSESVAWAEHVNRKDSQ